MVAFAEFYIIESVHGVRQRVSIESLRQRQAMIRSSAKEISASDAETNMTALADALLQARGTNK